MIKIIKKLPEHTIGFEAHNRITKEDYEKTIIPYIEKTINKCGKCNVIYHITSDYKGFDLGAMYDDAKIGLKYMKHINKMVIITDIKRIIYIFNFFSQHIMHENIKIFENNNYDKAMERIKK